MRSIHKLFGISLFIVGVFLASTLVNAVNSQQTSALTEHADLSTADEQMRSWYLYHTLIKCAESGAGQWASDVGDVSSGRWFNRLLNRTFYNGYIYNTLNDGSGGACRSNDSAISREAMQLWGIDDAIPLYCEINVQTRGDGSLNDCIRESGNFDYRNAENKDNRQSAMRAALEENIFRGKPPQLTPMQEWLFYQTSFMNTCGSGEDMTISDSRPTSGSYTLIGMIDGDRLVNRYVQNVVSGPNPSTDGFIISPASDRRMTCTEMANRTTTASDNAQAVQAFLDEGGAAEDIGGETYTEDSSADEPSSCQVEGVGWVVCPIITFMANISDGAFSIISNFLEVNVGLFQSTSGSGTYTAWQGFRTVANIAFIIVFIVIIYSQMSGVGVTNYGIKKMLPRLIIAVVLVNLSYFICQILIDLSNILGYTLKNFLTSIPTAPELPADFITNTFTDILAGGGIVLGVTAVGVVGITAVALGVAMPVLLAVALALLMTLIILIARQAGIVILTVLAPLAFVAYILPNTEQWFKRWFKMLWGLLLVFPMVGLLYGGGQLAARIIHNADPGSFWMAITAIGVSAVPLIMTPSLLKNSMNATGALGKRLSGWSGAANKKIGARVKDSSALGSRLQEYQSGTQRRRSAKQIRSRASSGFRGKGIDDILKATRLDKRLGADRGSILADQAEDKLFTDEVALQQTANNGQSPEAWLDGMGEKNESVESRAAKAGLVMKKGPVAAQYQALELVRQKMAEAVAANDTKEIGNLSLIQKQMAADMAKKPFGISGKHSGMLRQGILGHDQTDSKGEKVDNLQGQSITGAGGVFEQRLAEKLDGSSMASLDPDELSLAAKLASDGKMSHAALQSFTEQTAKARTSPTLASSITSGEKEGFIATILNAARDQGIDTAKAESPNKGQSTQQPAPLPSNTPNPQAPPSAQPQQSSAQPQEQSFDPNHGRDPSSAGGLRGGETTSDGGLIIPRDTKK